MPGVSYRTTRPSVWSETLENRRMLAATIYSSGGSAANLYVGGYPAGTRFVRVGEAIHVRALASTAVSAGTNGNDAFFNTKYEWSFTDSTASDPYGEYNPKLTTSVGFNAAHVWNRPNPQGQPYKVTLKVTHPNGTVETSSINVAVANAYLSPSPYGEGRHTLYVDDRSTIPNASGLSPREAIPTLASLNRILQTTYRYGEVTVKFHAGRTFK